MSLQTRLEALITALGADIKALQTGGGGGGTKASDLTAATSLGGTDKFVIVQGGNSKRIDASLVIPVPWMEVPLIVATAGAISPLAASAAAGVELLATPRSTRRKLDLSWASEVRLVSMVTANGNVAGVVWKMQYATAENATWTSSTGLADVGVQVAVGTGTVATLRDSGWQSLAAGARIDNCYVAMTNGATAQGTTAPTIGSLTAYFR